MAPQPQMQGDPNFYIGEDGKPHPIIPIRNRGALEQAIGGGQDPNAKAIGNQSQMPQGPNLLDQAVSGFQDFRKSVSKSAYDIADPIAEKIGEVGTGVLGPAAGQVKAIAQIAPYMLPGADLQDLAQSSQAFTKNLMQGDLAQASIEIGNSIGAAMAMFVPGSMGGARRLSKAGEVIEDQATALAKINLDKAQLNRIEELATPRPKSQIAAAPRVQTDDKKLEKKIRKVIGQVPGLKSAAKYLDTKELATLNQSTAQRLADIHAALPSATEMAHIAWAGRAKRGWYEDSGRVIQETFGDDAPRFTALLAAKSPQTSVEMNMENALNTWVNWNAAGRPKDRASIMRIMGESVRGDKGEGSVLDAWKNNSFTALTADDPLEAGLSGAKVDSFMRNLMGNMQEVTNDAWMARYAAMSGDDIGGSGGKKLTYRAYNAKVREAAAVLSEKTGRTWTPAEVQETIWSWSKVLYEGGPLKAGGQSAVDMVKSGNLTHEMVGDAPDFASLMSTPANLATLQRGGINVKQGSKAGTTDADTALTGSVLATAADSPFDAGDLERSQFDAAKRLDDAKKASDELSRAVGIRTGLGWEKGKSGGPKAPDSQFEPRLVTGRSEVLDEGHLAELKANKIPARHAAGVHQVDPEIRKNLEAEFVSAPDMIELKPTMEAATKFRQLMQKSLKGNPYKSSVWVYPDSDYANMKMFISADGSTGFALKGDDIVSVFNHGENATHPGAAYASIAMAIQNGGRRLDAFDTILPGLYSALGFRVASRTPWDETQKPKGWNKKLYNKFNKGTPDVVYMVYDPKGRGDKLYDRAARYKPNVEGHIHMSREQAIDKYGAVDSAPKNVTVHEDGYAAYQAAVAQQVDETAEIWGKAE